MRGWQDRSKSGVELWLERERAYRAKQTVVERTLLKKVGLLLLLVSISIFAVSMR